MKQLSLIKPRKKTPGARWGRPPSTYTGSRRARPVFASRHPLHITLRLREGLPNLRTRKGAKLVKHAIIGAQERGIRVIHFAVLSNHIHLIVEGKNTETLYRSMKSFLSRMGIGLRRWADNKVIEGLTSGGLGLFRGRYHIQVLKTPREVRNALKYVLLNPAKHFKKKAYLDRFTSAALFDDWKRLLGFALANNNQSKELRCRLMNFLTPPNLWLTHSGWQRAGP